MAKSSWGTKRQRAKGSWELRYRVGGKQKSVMFRGTARAVSYTHLTLPTT